MKLLVEESEFIYSDVQDIVRYLRRRNPAAAVRFVEAFKSTVDLLSSNHVGKARAPQGMDRWAMPWISTIRAF